MNEKNLEKAKKMLQKAVDNSYKLGYKAGYNDKELILKEYAILLSV